jgi:Mlc titration factor MtfA (ptsG expression regulator)
MNFPSFFRWLKKRRREQLLSQPFPSDWLRSLEENFALYHSLNEREQTCLRDRLRLLVAEKNWEGCGGLNLTAAIQVTVAAPACLMALELDDDCFAHVLTILVYPRGYLAPARLHLAGNAVLETEHEVEGQAHYHGPVIVSWEEVLAQGRHPYQGHNLVMHEFAHQLDMGDGVVDGTPLLPDRLPASRWQSVMSTEYRTLVEAVERGEGSVVNPYGTTNEGEFFAVATESFFNKPRTLARSRPRLYELLRDYYKQDPASRPSLT